MQMRSMAKARPCYCLQASHQDTRQSCSCWYITLSRGSLLCIVIRLCAVQIDHAADVNLASPKHGRVPLHNLASWGDVESVSLLLHYGADASLADTDGATSLHWCCKRKGQKHTATIEKLLAAHPSITERDKEGFTALHLAAMCYGNQDTVEALLKCSAQRGTKVFTPDFRGRTALHMACGTANLASAKHLLACGASPDEPDQDGNTAAHMAVQCSDVAVVQWLLSTRQCNMWKQNNNGHTPLDVAKENQNAAMITAVENAPSAVENAEQQPEPLAKKSKNAVPVTTLEMDQEEPRPKGCACFRFGKASPSSRA